MFNAGQKGIDFLRVTMQHTHTERAREHTKAIIHAKDNTKHTQGNGVNEKEKNRSCFFFLSRL